MSKKIISITAVLIIICGSSVAYFIYAGQSDEAKLKKYDMYNVNLNATVDDVKNLKGFELVEEGPRGLEYDITLKGKLFNRKADFIYAFNYDGTNVENLYLLSIGFKDDEFSEDYEKSIEMFNYMKTAFNNAYGEPLSETSGSVEDNNKYVWHNVEWISGDVKITLTSDLKSDNSTNQVIIVAFESI